MKATRIGSTTSVRAARLTDDLPEVQTGLEEQVERQTGPGETRGLQSVLHEVRVLQLAGRTEAPVRLQVLQQTQHLYTKEAT